MIAKIAAAAFSAALLIATTPAFRAGPGNLHRALSGVSA